MCPAVLLLYPCVCAFTRGNIYAMISSFCVVASFLLVTREVRYWLIAVFLLCLAIGLRPNNIVFLPFLCILCKKLYESAVPPLNRLILFSLACLAATGLASILLAEALYPNYSIGLFMEAYSFYSHAIEYGWPAADYSSSLFQPIKFFIMGLGRLIPPLTIDFFLPISRLLVILLGLLVCALSCRYLLRRKANIPRSLFICSCGMIIATPLLADYHLSVLVAPVLMAAYLDSDASYGVFQEVIKPSQTLPFIDSVAIILLLVPKSFPLLPLHVTAQTFINPLIIIVYLLVIFTDSEHRLPAFVDVDVIWLQKTIRAMSPSDSFRK